MVTFEISSCCSIRQDSFPVRQNSVHCLSTQLYPPALFSNAPAHVDMVGSVVLLQTWTWWGLFQSLLWFICLQQDLILWPRLAELMVILLTLSLECSLLTWVAALDASVLLLRRGSAGPCAAVVSLLWEMPVILFTSGLRSLRVWQYLVLPSLWWWV